MDDERLKKELTADLIGSRETTRRARDRAAPDAREQSTQDLLERFRQNMYTGVLPDLPEMPGYHVCWLSTTHPSDTIAKRLHMGYELISLAEYPALAHASVKTGEYAGCIGINEMIAARIPEELYQGYMEIAHHEAPRDLEESQVRKVDDLGEAARREKTALIVEGDGNEDMRRSAPSHGIFAS